MSDEQKIKKIKWLSTIIFGLALGACSDGLGFGSSGPTDATGNAPAQPVPVVAFNRFPDMPIPPGGEIDLDRTLVFGANDAWFGRLTVESSLDPNELFNFFKQEVPGFGWHEITSIRSARSFLTYTRGTRAVTIQIEGGFFSGGTAVITMSPQENQTPPQQKVEQRPAFDGAPAPRFRSGDPSTQVQQAPIMPAMPAPVLRNP
jgi:hypothetical protein